MLFRTVTATLALAALLFSCSSAPPAATTTKPATTAPQTAAPEKTAVPEKPVTAQTAPATKAAAPLTDAEYAEANTAIADAEAAEAARYSPDLLAKAKNGVEKAKGLAASDPDQARSLLKQAKSDADAARDAALLARKTTLISRLDKTMQMLKDIKADQYTPGDYLQDKARYDAAVAALNKDVKTGQPVAEATLKDLLGHYEKLSARLDKVTKLQTAAKKALDEADKSEAYIWVPDQLQEANDAYLQGSAAFKRTRLDSAEEYFTQAEFQASAAVARAKKEKDRKQTEDLMLETMKKIEKASNATVVDPQDNIIAPKPWDGSKELKDLTPPPAPKGQSMRIPADGSTVVLGEKSAITYLDEAKAAWEKGVQAMKAEDYVLANQFFLQSQKLVDAYMAMAVDKVYTVRLIPERRDSLWRIAEYANIFNDPFQWPKIWLRNKKLVQNPDLIYPGWTLIIPGK